MRKFVFGVSGFALAGAAILFTSVSAMAEGAGYDMTCSAYARMAADISNRPIMQRAGARDSATDGKVLMIAAGRKFFVPTTHDPELLASASAFDSLSSWNVAFNEAKWQCLHARSITFEVKK